MFISFDLLPQRLRLLNKSKPTQPCSHPSEHQTDPSRAMAYQGLKLVHVVYIKLHCRARKNEPLSRRARLISRGYFFMASDATINKRINKTGKSKTLSKKNLPKSLSAASVCRTNISSDGLSEKSAEPTYLRAIIYYLSHIAEIEGSTDEFPSDKSYHFEL